MPTPFESKLDPTVRGSVFQQLAEKITDGVWIFDASGAIAYANPAMEAMLGYTSKEVLGHQILDFVFSDDIQVAKGLLERAMQGISEAGEYGWRTKEGARLLTRCNTVPLTNNGEFVAAMAIVENITARRRSEEALSHLAAIIESSDDAIVSKDLNGIVKTWNKGAERVFGYIAEEMIGQPITKIIPEERVHEEDTILATLRKGQRIDHFHTIRRTKDGRYINVSATISPIRSGDGSLVGASKVARDISIEVLAEETRARLAAIVESSDDAIISKSLDGIILSWNKGAERIFGYTAEEVVGQPIVILFPDDRKGEEHLILDRLSKGYRIEHYDTVRKTKDGRLIDVSVTVSPIRDVTGRIIGASKVARDISEKKRAEAALKQSEEALRALTHQLEERVKERTAELEAANREMEGFTYSVSHDLRAPLRAIVSSSMIVLEDYGDALPDDATEQLSRQAAAAQKLAVLIDELLQLSRLSRAELHRTSVNLSKMAEEIAGELCGVPEGCGVKFEIQPGLKANGDPRLLRLAFQNLMDNARKFSPEGGTVVIGCMRVGGESTFYVKDEGIGFDMKYAHKVFLPFERLVTDTEFPGTGIGLANVKRIVERHGGSIRVESTLGEGSVFFLTLGPS